MEGVRTARITLNIDHATHSLTRRPPLASQIDRQGSSPPPPEEARVGDSGNMALLGQGFEGGVMAAVKAAKNAVDALGVTGRRKTTE